MYKNLKAEMIRQSVTVQQIANALNIKVDTARLKINGKISISIIDCQTVAKLFSTDNDVSFLFER